jgi:hypothetical protein
MIIEQAHRNLDLFFFEKLATARKTAILTAACKISQCRPGAFR